MAKKTVRRSRSNASGGAEPEKVIGVRIRFSADEHERIRIAAARRGCGFNMFVRLASSQAAKNAMEIPPDKVLGRDVVLEAQA
jgi:predicted HicB family RNase H-like nuclease